MEGDSVYSSYSIYSNYMGGYGRCGDCGSGGNEMPVEVRVGWLDVVPVVEEER